MNWAATDNPAGDRRAPVAFPRRGERLVLVLLLTLAALVLLFDTAEQPPPTPSTPVGYVYILGDALDRPGAYPFRTDRPLGVREVYLRAGGDPALLERLPALEIAPPQLVFFQRRTLTAEGPLDLNRAPAVLLEELPGIGPVLARRIVAGRPYENPAELLAVSGIGPALLAELEGLVVVR